VIPESAGQWPGGFDLRLGRDGVIFDFCATLFVNVDGVLIDETRIVSESRHCVMAME